MTQDPVQQFMVPGLNDAGPSSAVYGSGVERRRSQFSSLWFRG